MTSLLNFIVMSALYWYVLFSLFVTYNLVKALYVKFCCTLSEYYEHYYPEYNHYDNTENV